MAQNKLNVVRIGKESTRGTAVTGALTVPHLDDGLKIGFTNHLGKIYSSRTFPSMTDQVPLGLTPVVRLRPEVNVATIRDLILMNLMRTSGALPEFTIEETIVAQQKAAGCVNRSLEASFSRSESPDQAALLSLQMEFAAMSIASTTGITAGTYGGGHQFPLAQATFSLNSVPALEIMSFSWKANNTLFLGPHDATRKLLYIEDGQEEHTFTLTARFASAAWRALATAGDRARLRLHLPDGHGHGDGDADLRQVPGGES